MTHLLVTLLHLTTTHWWLLFVGSLLVNEYFIVDANAFCHHHLSLFPHQWPIFSNLEWLRITNSSQDYLSNGKPLHWMHRCDIFIDKWFSKFRHPRLPSTNPLISISVRPFFCISPEIFPVYMQPYQWCMIVTPQWPYL